MELLEKILKRKIYYHSLIWLLSVLIVVTFWSTAGVGFIEKVKDTSGIVIPSFILTYVLFFCKEYLFAKKQFVIFVILAIVIISVSGYLTAHFNAFLYGEGAELNIRQWIQNMSIVGFIVLVSQIAKRGIISQLQLQKLQVEQLKMEIQLLKGQLNPHFLFNTINNICGVNQVDSEKSTEMLINLAELLRYHLEFTVEQKIPIDKEVQLIEAYIELEKMRLRDNCLVTFEQSEKKLDLAIAPLLLLPFVENAFKHGTHTSHPCFINIKLMYKNEKLEFFVENSLFKNQKVSSTNIGQQNTIKRLQLLYPEKHQLRIRETDKKYTVELIIDL